MDLALQELKDHINKSITLAQKAFNSSIEVGNHIPAGEQALILAQASVLLGMKKAAQHLDLLEMMEFHD